MFCNDINRNISWFCFIKTSSRLIIYKGYKNGENLIMTTIFWALGNVFLIILILLRIPRRKSTIIDKNPKILNVLIKIFIGIYLISNCYLNIFQ